MIDSGAHVAVRDACGRTATDLAQAWVHETHGAGADVTKLFAGMYVLRLLKVGCLGPLCAYVYVYVYAYVYVYVYVYVLHV